MDWQRGKCNLGHTHRDIVYWNLRFLRYKRREVPVFWGVPFHGIDKKFIDLLTEGIKKRFRMGPHLAVKKLNTGLNESRIRARARLRVRVLNWFGLALSNNRITLSSRTPFFASNESQVLIPSGIYCFAMK